MTDSNFIFCPKCGAQNPADAGFCIKCGSAFPNLETMSGDATKMPQQAPQQKASASPGDTISDEFTNLNIHANVVIGERYEIKHELGRGGMGIVYRAYDRILKREVALKVLPPELSSDAYAREQLFEEARKSIDLTHENMVRLYNVDHRDGVGFIVMELVEGPTLLQLLREKMQKDGKPFGEKEAIGYMTQICKGLEYAHSREYPIIHRDLKPANILVSPNGTLKIADFGIARMIKDSMSQISKKTTSGTLVYMPPEQLMGKKVDARTDIYALGATGYELLSGHPPFYQGGIEFQILHSEPEIIEGISEQTWEIIEKSLAKKKEDRWNSAAEMRKAMEGKRVVATPKKKPESVPKNAEGTSNRKALTGLLIAAVIVLMSVSLYMLLPIQPSNESDKSELSAVNIGKSSQQLPANLSYQKEKEVTIPPKKTVSIEGKANAVDKKLSPKSAVNNSAKSNAAPSNANGAPESGSEPPNKNQIPLKHEVDTQATQAALGKEADAEATAEAQIYEAKQQSQVQIFLDKAANYMAKEAYTTPTGENAYEAYQSVLAIEPKNPKALAGCEKIADIYEDWAIKSDENEKYAEAISYYEKAGLVSPTRDFSKEIYSIQQYLTHQQEQAQKAAQKSSSQAKQSPTIIGKEGTFTAYINGVVVDADTGLMWASKDNGEDVTWDDAKIYCERYKGGGYSNWRMPTVDELRSLRETGDGYGPECAESYTIKITKYIHISCTWVWASEDNGSQASYIDFYRGAAYETTKSYERWYRVLPVRDSK